jgi:hypothetical protein
MHAAYKGAAEFVQVLLDAKASVSKVGERSLLQSFAHLPFVLLHSPRNLFGAFLFRDMIANLKSPAASKLPCTLLPYTDIAKSCRCSLKHTHTSMLWMSGALQRCVSINHPL